MEPLSLAFGDYAFLLRTLDQSYLRLLSRYFDLEKAGLYRHTGLADGAIPAAEIGSSEESALLCYNYHLWSHRRASKKGLEYLGQTPFKSP